MINIKYLSHSFGRYWALKNISFSLDKGDFLFLTGPSGAGKTTLMRLLHGSLPLQRGMVSIAGFDLKSMPLRKLHLLRRQVSIVFQDFRILPDRTVWDNVALPLLVRGMVKSQIQKRVRAVLRSLRLDKKSWCLCREISGGEQQRVAVARAVVVNPKVLLADEPTGNLDRKLALQLLEVFRQFHIHGTTIIFATHNEELIKSQPQAKILCLKDGGIVDSNWPLEGVEI
ncbi:cell division ATP-binding protein FtsE [Desulfonatronovibrio hydrogenovorans]|uniref:cell division ATP-binding protein FtsE n=1 Tax=Desulfonatronovibrio hydrogenovorans TaxID=53245 RepID=UPI00048C2A4D|nr:cell division ATP-binding protein FtsE [Desulfonatronovibrio hydrogenovorans]